MKTKATRVPWAVGFDPGYGHSGAVLRRSDYPHPEAWSCWENDSTKDWVQIRAMSIAIPAMERIIGWVEEHKIEDLEFCIEYPIYNGNAKVLMTQMSLFDLVCTSVYDYLRPIVPHLYLTTVNNRTSKRLLAHDGMAKKPAMVGSSPWARYKSMGLTFEQAHTLADSYAHSLVAGSKEFNLTHIEQYSELPTVAHDGRIREENMP